MLGCNCVEITHMLARCVFCIDMKTLGIAPSYLQPESRLRLHQRTNGVKFIDTVDKHLQTRLRQLDTAIELRKWTLARITMLDINTIIDKAKPKRMPNRSLVWQTYVTLSRAFWFTDEMYAHACALSDAFSLKKKFHKNFAPAVRTREVM